MTAQQTKRQDGFTLTEAMIATVILALALASVIGICGRCMRYLTDIRRTARASQVLQQKMEDIRLLNWTQLQTLTNAFTDPADTNKIYKGVILTNSFTEAKYGTTDVVMRVTLLVTWTNQNRRVLSNQLTTLIANGGLNKYIF